MPRRTLLAIAVGILTLTPLRAQGVADKCKSLCAPPTTLSGVIDFIVDGDTRNRTGPAEVKPGEKIRIILKKNNPFKTTYRIDIKKRTIDVANALDFVSMIPGFGTSFSGIPGLPKAADAPELLKKVPAYANWESRWKSISEGQKALSDSIDKLKGAIDAHDEFVKAVNADPAPSMIQLCTSAGQLNETLLAMPKAVDIEGKEKDLQEALGGIAALQTALDAGAKEAAVPLTDGDKARLVSEFQGEVEKRKKQADDIKALITKSTEIRGKLNEKKAKLDATQSNILGVLGSTNAFYEVALEDTARSGEIWDIKVNDKDVNGVTSGGAKILLSVGVGLSTIDDVKIVRQSGLDTDGKTVVNKFGYENNSSFKPSGVVMLNAMVKDWKSVSFGPAVGLVLSGRGDTAQAEFLAGGSVGLAENRVFLSLGFHAAQVQALGGGFKVGDKVPDGLADPLPIQKNWKPGMMFSITFKIR